MGLVARHAVGLRTRVPILMLRTRVPARRMLEGNLSTCLTITAIAHVGNAVVVGIFSSVLSILVGAYTIERVRCACELSLCRVNCAVVVCRADYACHDGEGVLTHYRELSLMNATRLLRLVLLVERVRAKVRNRILHLSSIAAGDRFRSRVDRNARVNRRAIMDREECQRNVNVGRVQDLKDMPIRNCIRALLRRQRIRANVGHLLCLPLRVEITIKNGHGDDAYYTIGNDCAVEFRRDRENVEVSNVLVANRTVSYAGFRVICLLSFLRPELVTSCPNRKDEERPTPLLAVARLKEAVNAGVSNDSMSIDGRVISADRVEARNVFNMIELRVAPTRVNDDLRIVRLRMINVGSVYFL